METLHDVLRLLVRKAEHGGRLLPEEAEQAIAAIDRDEAARNAPVHASKSKGKAATDGGS